MKRRSFEKRCLAALLATSLSDSLLQETASGKEKNSATHFEFKYIVGSSMYGYESLESILPEVRKTGATTIDIWPKVHGNQREQIESMGEEAFRKLLDANSIAFGCITQYKLGPFGLAEELLFAQRFGCRTIVTGAVGPRDLKGQELKQAVVQFIEKMKPHLEKAEEAGVTIAIENHGNNLIDSPDAIRWLAELRSSENLGIALAPYHLPQDENLIASLIKDCAPAIAMFYAWQHGNGCMSAQPKETELLQMPGRGPLDFAPIIQALRDIQYQGWTEIFMHPYPRGIAILDDIPSVTAEINRARDYLEKL